MNACDRVANQALDKMSVSHILAFQEALLKECETTLSSVISEIREKKTIASSLDDKLRQFFDGFTEKFLATR